MEDQPNQYVARQFRGGDRIVTLVDTSVPSLPPLLSIDDAAAVLKTTRLSIVRAINAGELPTVTLSGRQKIVTGRLLERFYAEDDARVKRLAARLAVQAERRSAAGGPRRTTRASQPKRPRP